MRRALDLFCGAGGASMGLHRAGFDVTGVDKHPHPEYPFTFVQADALSYPLEGFDLIWASPPCQAFSVASHGKRAGQHKNLIPQTRERLRSSGAHYIIENVPGAPLEGAVMLCGAMFGLGVIRHRYFECSFTVSVPVHPKHAGSVVTGEYVTVTGNGGVPKWTLDTRGARGLPRNIPGETSMRRWSEAMGIDWMKREDLTQAIPPAYAQHIAEQAPAGQRVAA